MSAIERETRLGPTFSKLPAGKRREGGYFLARVTLSYVDRLPADLRRELSSVVGSYLAKELARKGVTERNIKEDSPPPFGYTRSL